MWDMALTAPPCFPATQRQLSQLEDKLRAAESERDSAKKEAGNAKASIEQAANAAEVSHGGGQ